MQKSNIKRPRIKQNEHIFALKVRTESNTLGIIKTLVVLLLILLQVGILALSYLFFIGLFRWYITFSIVMTLATCIYVLSSDSHGQAKATWIFFLLISFGFGYFIYFLSDKHICFAYSRKKYNKILSCNKDLQVCPVLNSIENGDIRANAEYLNRAGGSPSSLNSRTTYFPSGAGFFDSVLDEIKKADKFIFIEFFIIADGVLLNRFLDVLKEKAKSGVDVRIIYDDMGSHRTIKRRTKKEIAKSGIKLQPFNRLVPVFNLALNLRDHRKIIVVDGKIGFTGGANLADEYVNEKRMHGYWKDAGVRLEGKAIDNFTIAFLNQWEFLTNKRDDVKNYIDIADEYNSDGVVIPFVSGPNQDYSVSENIYANLISSAKEKLYIMTPYFIPDETITNLIINKARSGVDVRIILPEVADKKIVYMVTRNNAEKLLKFGVKVYTMGNSFVHSKVILTESSAIIGSINVDLRSFYQQFESAIFTSEIHTLKEVNADFNWTIQYCNEITPKNAKRNSQLFRMLAGLFNLISPFM